MDKEGNNLIIEIDSFTINISSIELLTLKFEE